MRCCVLQGCRPASARLSVSPSSAFLPVASVRFRQPSTNCEHTRRICHKPGRCDASAPSTLEQPACLHDEDEDVLVEFRNVHKSFGPKKVLRGATFHIKRGEAVGIIGGSGTGKSTTLRLISGLLQPDSGEVIIKGRKRTGLVSDANESEFGLQLGLVFQNAALFDSLTVGENVGFQLYEHSELADDEILRLVRANLAKVGLIDVDQLYPSQLSGGMKKRVALARAITADMDSGLEKLIMYDEPTAGLDPVASTVVEDLMRSLHTPDSRSSNGSREKGVTSYMVVTHQHSTIRRAVDRLVFLHEGKVVWQGPTAEFDTSENEYVRQFANGLLEGPIKYA